MRLPDVRESPHRRCLPDHSGGRETIATSIVNVPILLPTGEPGRHQRRDTQLTITALKIQSYRPKRSPAPRRRNGDCHYGKQNPGRSPLVPEGIPVRPSATFLQARRDAVNQLEQYRQKQPAPAPVKPVIFCPSIPAYTAARPVERRMPTSLRQFCRWKSQLRLHDAFSLLRFGISWPSPGQMRETL